MRAVTAQAPGKVNIQLSVGPLRPDGFHPLASVFHGVSLFERVTLTAAPLGAGISLGAITGEQADLVPRDESNLAWRAAAAVAEAAGTPADLRIDIVKAIPVAGGLAGGSADCAAALVAANRLLGAHFTPARLAELGAELGSDVPFALLGGTAAGLGRGEVLSPLASRSRFHWTLATSAIGLSTPAVYRHYDTMRPDAPAPEISREVVAALITGDPRALGRVLINDLQAPALSLQPGLRQVLAAADDAGACGALVSGSGPTIAVLARNEAHAVQLGAILMGTGLVTRTYSVYGPVPGARIVN
ncbi:MAG: 4-(cytidine 5'-diphospho)-2-C-methyl-D-erythritol kinase [Candidatus Nanopelagicales bacterium]